MEVESPYSLWVSVNCKGFSLFSFACLFYEPDMLFKSYLKIETNAFARLLSLAVKSKRDRIIFSRAQPLISEIPS